MEELSECLRLASLAVNELSRIVKENYSDYNDNRKSPRQRMSEEEVDQMIEFTSFVSCSLIERVRTTWSKGSSGKRESNGKMKRGNVNKHPLADVRHLEKAIQKQAKSPGHGNVQVERYFWDLNVQDKHPFGQFS